MPNRTTHRRQGRQAVGEFRGAGQGGAFDGRHWGLLAFLVAVFPANVYMVGLAGQLHIPAWVLWARLPLQPLLMWAVWRAAR